MSETTVCINIDDIGMCHGANVAFVAFLPVAGLSYSIFEKRFLAYRKHYLRAPAAAADTSKVAVR